MAISVSYRGAATITATGPGILVAQEVTAAGCTSGDQVFLTPADASAFDGFGAHSFYAVSGSGKFTIYSYRGEVPSTVLNYIVCTGS